MTDDSNTIAESTLKTHLSSSKMSEHIAKWQEIRRRGIFQERTREGLENQTPAREFLFSAAKCWEISVQVAYRWGGIQWRISSKSCGQKKIKIGVGAKQSLVLVGRMLFSDQIPDLWLLLANKGLNEETQVTFPREFGGIGLTL